VEKDGAGVIVVTDTSVVLNLAWLREERLLSELFGSVLAPPAVRAEFERLALADHRFRGLRFPDFVTVVAPARIPDSLAANDDLDPGEIDALALALERGIRNVLMDETAGRAAAIAHGLQPSGLLGLLVEAKRRALISAVLPLLDRLRDSARFRVGDDLRHRIATLAGETP
jgi:predicted nucleic acid-binding protein